ncbi:MAG TPA: PH domain-containing protein [Candidatus Saccharimonadales bacterium]|nr:PH domain-containing protein [Candidatus Saccharimonadales bacterium]
MSKKAKHEAEHIKPKYFKEQFDDEEVKLVFKKHPIVMRKGLILASFGVLAGMIPALIKPTYGWFFGGLGGGLALGIILIFPWWVKWYFSVYIMTDQRFIQQSRSLLQINFVDIGLDQIQMINYQIAGLEETLLHFGTITVQTYVGDLVIHDVHHPEKIQKKMVHTLRDMGVHPTQRPFQPESAGAVSREETQEA